MEAPSATHRLWTLRLAGEKRHAWRSLIRRPATPQLFFSVLLNLQDFHSPENSGESSLHVFSFRVVWCLISEHFVLFSTSSFPFALHWLKFLGAYSIINALSLFHFPLLPFQSRKEGDKRSWWLSISSCHLIWERHTNSRQSQNSYCAYLGGSWEGQGEMWPKIIKTETKCYPQPSSGRHDRKGSYSAFVKFYLPPAVKIPIGHSLRCPQVIFYTLFKRLDDVFIAKRLTCSSDFIKYSHESKKSKSQLAHHQDVWEPLPHTQWEPSPRVLGLIVLSSGCEAL